LSYAANRQTNKQTDSIVLPTPTDRVSLDNNKSLCCDATVICPLAELHVTCGSRGCCFSQGGKIFRQRWTRCLWTNCSWDMYNCGI